MKKRIAATLFSLSLSTLPVAMAHDPVHDKVAVEIEGSSLATPDEIHVRETENGVEVKGKLDRTRHNNQSLRGHVDVALVDSQGRVIASEVADISVKAASAKHDHYRNFAVTLPLPESKDYSVRVSHNIGGDKHE